MSRRDWWVVSTVIYNRHNNKSSDGTAALQSVSATSMQWVTSIFTVIVAVAISGPLSTQALPSGAPTDACFSLTPNHPASQASDVPGGYFIDTELRDENFVYNTSEQDSYNGTYIAILKC